MFGLTFTGFRAVFQPVERGKSIIEPIGLFWFVETVARELALFAAIGFLIGGIDDLCVDLIWIVRSVRRRIFGKGGDRSLANMPAPSAPGRYAIFVPAWQEAEVIGAMLDHSARQLAGRDYRLFAGCYPNDPETAKEIGVAAASVANIHRVTCIRKGPTTKADCLNNLWQAMRAEERRSGRKFAAVVLHDAEDLIHAREIDLYDRALPDHALVQIPVEPLIDRDSRWIGGHYCDEFAEAHGKDIPVRSTLGAGVPSAGVGCAIDRAVLGNVAAERGGDPFQETSLTEDYELGLRIAERGHKGRFVRARDDDGDLICVRAHFPGRLNTSIRQKTRWITGIALAGWDRLGWSGGFAERWMRLRDRRAILAAIVLLAAYAALLALTGLFAIAALTSLELRPVPTAFATLLAINFALLCWRLAMRSYFTSRSYGIREGFRAIPRAIIANIIAMIAARRAMTRYLVAAPKSAPKWDKTTHVFPDRAQI